jgi:hypothetical protein
LVAYAEAAAGIHPFDRLLVAGKPAAPALQATLVGESDMPVPDGIAIGRTHINTYVQLAIPAFGFIDRDMDLAVDLELVQG